MTGIGSEAEAETGSVEVVAEAGKGTGGGEAAQGPEAMEVIEGTAEAGVVTRGGQGQDQAQEI